MPLLASLEEEVTERVAVVDWDGLVARLLHETQLHIIEAMRWIDRPLSSTDLSRVFGMSVTHQNLSHHLGRLAQLGVVTLMYTSQGRGKAKFYRLAAADEHGACFWCSDGSAGADAVKGAGSA